MWRDGNFLLQHLTNWVLFIYFLTWTPLIAKNAASQKSTPGLVNSSEEILWLQAVPRNPRSVYLESKLKHISKRMLWYDALGAGA